MIAHSAVIDRKTMDILLRGSWVSSIAIVALASFRYVWGWSEPPASIVQQVQTLSNASVGHHAQRPEINRSSSAQWTQSDFVLATFHDPRLSGRSFVGPWTAGDVRSLSRARDAYFNLLTGFDPDRSDNSPALMDYALYVARQAGLGYLVRDVSFYGQPFSPGLAASTVLRYSQEPSVVGFMLKDEPTPSDVPNLREWVSYLRTHDPLRAAYVNLFPRHYFSDPGPSGDQQYELYLDSVLSGADEMGDASVASFDFYPFSGSPPTVASRYFYNLHIIRVKAGQRPFWAYPLSTGHGAYPDPDVSQLRFMAFCPIAYGAKGLVYFTYEIPYGPRLLIDYVKDGLGTWSLPRTYGGCGIDAVPAIADFDGDGVDDLSLKEGLGDQRWLIDYSSNGFGDWDETALRLYGDSSAHPVPADYDCDGREDLSVKEDTGNQRWLIDYASNGFGTWDETTFFLYGDSTVHPVPADYDGDGWVDLGGKEDAGSQRWLIDYASNGYGTWDETTLVQYGDSRAHPVPADYDGDGKADLSVKEDIGNQRWLMDYAWNGFGSWDETALVQYGDSNAHAVPADYDGDGKADLGIKEDIGSQRWLIDYAWNGFGTWDETGLAQYGGANTRPVLGDFDGDGSHDLGVKTNQADYMPALIGPCGDPTPNYFAVRTLNRYIQSVVGPVVMGTRCLGCFHMSTAPTGEALSADQLIGPASPFVASLGDPKVMVGIFRANGPRHFYGLLVNKSLDDIPGFEVILKGNFSGAIQVAPSVVGHNGTTQYTSVPTAYEPLQDWTRFFLAEGLAGGEGRLFVARGKISKR